MAKNIEMNNLNSDGSYEVIYPKTNAQIVTISESLQAKLNRDNVNDVLADLDTRLELSQYGCAAIQVTLRSTNGNPLEGIKINGISKNLDMTGECYTDSNGYVQGYVQAGSVTLSSENYADLSVTNSGAFTVVTGYIYSKEMTGTIINFQKYISSTSIKFSNNMSRLDVTCVGGGGAAGIGDMHWGSGGGGGGGYVTVQENVSFTPLNENTVIIGSGGSFSSYNTNGNTGGTTTFLEVSASGGSGGTRNSGGTGNGNGASPALKTTEIGQAGATYGNTGFQGTQYGYSSFTSTSLYGGGGGSGGLLYGYSNGTRSGGSGGSPGGGKGGAVDCKNGTATYGSNGVAGTGGGGGSRAEGYNGSGLSYNSQSGSGGCGCVAIRMHPKVY